MELMEWVVIGFTILNLFIYLDSKIDKLKRGLDGYDREFTKTSHLMHRLERIEKNIGELQSSLVVKEDV